MLSWTVLFLLIAIAAGLLGFGLIGGTAYMLAKICFFLFIVLFLVSLVRGRRGAPL
jgi:uncharacterized membrane protein YtjA (UPF0391 family)